MKKPLILLVFYVFITGCQKDCYPGRGKIPLVQISSWISYESENGACLPPHIEWDCFTYSHFNGEEHTVEYCQDDPINFTDSTVVIVGNGCSLAAVNDFPFSRSPFMVGGITRDDELIGSVGSKPVILSSGEEFSQSVEHIDTFMWSKDSCFWEFAEWYGIDCWNYREIWENTYEVYDRINSEWVPAPDTCIVTTISNYYIKVVGFFEQDEFIYNECW